MGTSFCLASKAVKVIAVLEIVLGLTFYSLCMISLVKESVPFSNTVSRFSQYIRARDKATDAPLVIAIFAFLAAYATRTFFSSLLGFLLYFWASSNNRSRCKLWMLLKGIIIAVGGMQIVVSYLVFDELDWIEIIATLVQAYFLFAVGQFVIDIKQENGTTSRAFKDYDLLTISIKILTKIYRPVVDNITSLTPEFIPYQKLHAAFNN